VRFEFMDEGKKQKRYYLSGKGEALALILETLDNAHAKNLEKLIRRKY
jgi:hypothetical protein